MLLAVWKFVLDKTDQQIIQVPVGAKVLSVAEQQSEIVLYFLVQPGARKVDRQVFIYGTGHPIYTDEKDCWSPRNRFVGTVNLLGGKLMFHVFVEE